MNFIIKHDFNRSIKRGSVYLLDKYELYTYLVSVDWVFTFNIHFEFGFG